MYSFSRTGTWHSWGDARRVEPFERFEHGGVGPGLGLDRIEEVARVDEDIFVCGGLLHLSLTGIIVHLLLAEVHTVRAGAVECGEAQVSVGDVDEFHGV
jgi:hypothetical protein